MLPTPSQAPSPLPLLRFAALDNVPHAISTRHGGVSQGPFASLNMGLSTGDLEECVLANRKTFVDSLGVTQRQVVFGRLSHGNEVSIFRRSANGQTSEELRRLRNGASHSQAVFRSDGVVSNVPGLHFFLTFADCLPLAFWDREHEVVGAAHAGWRGTALGIAPAVIGTMSDAFDSCPGDLLVGIGPSIGPCCYRVTSEVVDSFNNTGFDPVIQKRNEFTYLDLWTTNERQLQQAGVPAESIENSRICTSCNRYTFYSHRAEQGKTGRFALCIGLNERGD